MAEHTELLVKNFDEIRNRPDLLQEIIMHNETHRLKIEEQAGKLAAGTSFQTGAMMQQAQKIPLPQLPQIYQTAVAMNQMQNESKAEAGAMAPTEPGGKIDPQAPSENTSNAKSAAKKGGL